MGPDTRCGAGAYAGRFVRPDCQSLAAVPVAELPRVGTQRPIAARWRLRFPRSTAGRRRADLHAARAVPGTSAARRVAAVRRRGCAALVAPAEWTRHAYALLRRPAVAAVCRGRLRCAHGR